MKLNRSLGLIAVAVATVGAGTVAVQAATNTVAVAPTTTAATSPAAGKKHWGHHRGGMLIGMLLHATHQLDLTAEQQAAIKGVLQSARSQHAAGTNETDFAVLANPGDPNYANATQAAKSRLEARFQQQIELQGQIYNLLTPAQKAKLPTVLATMQAQAQQRRAQWSQQHAGGNSGRETATN